MTEFGRGLFAKRDIEKHELVLEEPPGSSTHHDFHTKIMIWSGTSFIPNCDQLFSLRGWRRCRKRGILWGSLPESMFTIRVLLFSAKTKVLKSENKSLRIVGLFHRISVQNIQICLRSRRAHNLFKFL